MKRRFWLIPAGILLLALILVGVGLMLPSEASVSRSIGMKGPATYIHSTIRDPRQMQQWLTFGVQHPATRVRVEGAARGEGAVLVWSRDGVSERRMAITGGEPGAFVFHEADLGYRFPAQGRFEIVDEGPRKRVTWTLTLSFGNNLVGRYMGTFMGLVVGPEMRSSLINLKNTFEGPVSPFPPSEPDQPDESEGH